MSIPKYPAYKESNTEWFGEVPVHWSTTRLDAVLDTHRKTLGPEELAGKTVFHYSIPVVQTCGDGQLEDGSEIDSNKLLIEEPQVLVSKLNPRKGTVCIAQPHDATTVGSTEFVPLLPRLTDIRFTWYLVQAESYRARLESLVESATKSHQRTTPSDICKAKWAFPPIEEQCTIVAFLDRETAKIDALIAEQQRLIELLQEKMQAVISHAVTKGLNPNAPMKVSGVEWLGEVPEHWEIIRLKRVAPKRCDGPFGSGLKSEHYVESGVFVVRLQNIKEAGLDSSSKAFIDTGYYQQELGDHDVEAGDLLIAGLGDENNPVGRACVAPAEIEPAMVKADCFRYRLDASLVNPSFAALSLNTSARYHGGKMSSGSTRARIPLSQMSEREIALPSLEEQTIIIEKLVTEMSAMDSLHRPANDAVVLLQERRSALISAAVTGQIDVRGLVEVEVGEQ